MRRQVTFPNRFGWVRLVIEESVDSRRFRAAMPGPHAGQILQNFEFILQSALATFDLSTSTKKGPAFGQYFLLNLTNAMLCFFCSPGRGRAEEHRAVVLPGRPQVRYGWRLSPQAAFPPVWKEATRFVFL